MLERTTLKTRMLAGASIAFVVAGLLFTVSVLALSSIARQFERFAQLQSNAALVQSIVNDTSELQRDVEAFIYQGHDSSAREVYQLHEALDARIREHAAKPTPQLGAGLEETRAHLSAYVEVFGQVETQRKRRLELVSRELVSVEARARGALLSALDAGGAGRDELRQAVVDFASLQSSASRYFTALDSRHVDEALSSLRRLERLIGELERSASTNVPETIDHARSTLDALEATFLEAVQRTRAYLYLVNVVMAAEAYEVRHAARRLREQTSTQMAESSAAVESTLRQSLWFETLALALACLLSLAAFRTIFRSVQAPVMSLSKTFRELAAGRPDVEIPPHPVDDELGQLTEAARVFRARNAETERLLAREQVLTHDLQRNQRALQRSQDEMEQFVYTVSHDLKSPLVTSMGFIAIAQREAEEGDLKGAMGRLDRVVQANERMGELINDLLELSRVGRVDVEMEAVDLDALVARLAASVEPALTRSGLVFRTAGPLPTIRGNAGRLLQVFDNLVGNAIKYAAPPAGSYVEIGATSTPTEHRVYVRDDGPGIAEAYREKVFGLFYRLARDTSGTGIGLAVVRKVMLAHEGRVWIDPGEEGGATFWLGFPREGGSAEAEPSREETPHAT